MAKQSLKSKCAHDWEKRWEGAFRKCRLCSKAQWWWYCAEIWRSAMPSAVLFYGHDIAKKVAKKCEESEDDMEKLYGRFNSREIAAEALEEAGALFEAEGNLIEEFNARKT